MEGNLLDIKLRDKINTSNRNEKEDKNERRCKIYITPKMEMDRLCCQINRQQQTNGPNKALNGDQGKAAKQEADQLRR